MENDVPPADGRRSLRPAEAREALEQLHVDGACLAARVVTPWWYHPALGVIVAALAASQAFPVAAAIITVAIGISLLPVLTIVYARRYGLSPSRPAGRRSRLLLAATLGVLVAAMLASLAIRILSLSTWWVLVPAALAFCATIVLGRRYDDALRDEVGERAEHPA